MNVGDIVKVSRENDNDGYDSFRNENLKIVYASYSVEDHPGYDESMDGMGLFDLETLDGKQIGCSLYEYELEYV